MKDPLGLMPWAHFIGTLGERAAERAFTALGWQLVSKVASTTTKGFDLVFLERTAEGPVLRVVENKAWGRAASLGEKALSAVVTNYEANLAKTATQAAQSSLNAALKQEVATAIERNAVRTVVTNFYGSAIKVGSSVATDAAGRITVMTASEVLEAGAARATAEAAAGSMAARAARFGGKALGVVVGSVLSVGGMLLTMDSPAHAADYTPEQLQLDSLNELIAKGYTDQPRNAFKRSPEEAASVEIETWRLTRAEFEETVRIVGSMGGTSPGDRQHFVQELREERQRLTDASD